MIKMEIGSVFLLFCCCCCCLIHPSVGQDISSGQWRDDFRLDFTYDQEGQRGPDNWRQVDISESEWIHYRENHPIHDVNVNGNLCGAEPRPSPVNLFQTFPCNDNHEMITPQITDATCQPQNLSYELTPSSLRVYFPFDNVDADADADTNTNTNTNTNLCDKPSVRLSGTPNPFVLQWMELHIRSEHVIDGRRFDAELQMVHMGSGRTSGQLAIVSLMIQSDAREDHNEFQQIIDRWQQTANQEDAACSQNNDNTVRRQRRLRRQQHDRLRKRVLYAAAAMTTDTDTHQLNHEQTTISHNNETSPAINTHRHLQNNNNQNIFKSPCDTDRFGNGCEPLGPRRKIFPYNLWPTIWYFSYRGSITAPPCASIVQWRVLDIPLRISRRQYKQIANLSRRSRNDQCENDTQTNTITGENVRPLQTLDDQNQRVSHCMLQHFSYWAYPADEQ